MPYSALSDALPVDSNGRRFMGVSGRLFAGTTSVDNANEAIVHTLLVDANNDALVSATGLLVRGGAATASDASDGTDDELITGAAAGLRLMGFSVKETSGSATSAFFLRNGISNAGALTYTVTLAANESRGEWFGPDGIASASGIWLERTSGNTTAVVFWKVAS